VGRDSSVGIATGYAWTVRSGGGEIFRIRPHRPEGPRSLLYNDYRVSLREVKRPGLGVGHTPSSVEVKGRVEVYLDFPCGPSWTVLGYTLPLHIIYYYVDHVTFKGIGHIGNVGMGEGQHPNA